MQYRKISEKNFNLLKKKKVKKDNKLNDLSSLVYAKNPSIP